MKKGQQLLAFFVLRASIYSTTNGSVDCPSVD